jgi:LacI family transcriptional regulator
MTKKESIVLVAEQAGCSVATVSNVLNNKGRVGAATRENVLLAVKDLKYQPNSMGRGLRLQQTETIGLLFYPSCSEIFRNPFYAEVVEGIEIALQKAGYDLLLSSYEASHKFSKVPDLLSRGKADGLILLGAFPLEILRAICKQKAHLVLIDSNADLPVNTIGTDGFSAELNIVKHLYSLGHRRILFLGYNFELPNIDFREQGFLAGLQQTGLKGGKKR